MGSGLNYIQELILITISPEKHLGRHDDLEREYRNDPYVLRQINRVKKGIYAKWDSMLEDIEGFDLL